MNREIRFRAWDNKQKEFHTWESLKCNSISVAYLFNNTDLRLLQYTGLKDKNGKEIYEGDICRCWGGVEFNSYYEYNKIYEVKWQGSGFDMIINDCGYGWNYSSGFDYIEIIGNIYENPELLKD